MRIPKLRNHAAAGFSFLELIMYILIIGILAGGGMYVYTRWVGRARLETTKTNLRLLQNNVNFFHTEQNKYPTALSELVKEKMMPKIPKDGWGQDFRYKVTAGGKDPYELYSFGASGPQGKKEDRISAWDI